MDELPGMPKGFTAPPTYGASKIAVTVTSEEIIITVGQSRSLIDSSTGQPTNRAATEWFGSYSFSATAAQNLHMALGAALSTYEARFGKIPRDPGRRVAPRDGGEGARDARPGTMGAIGAVL